MTFGSTLIADTAVPLATGLIGLAVSFSDLFLFNSRVMVSCTVILEVMGFEVPEMPKFGQLNVLDFSCVSTDGFVKVNNFGVRKGKGSKKLKDVFRVLLQFVSAMGEGTENGGSGGVPSDGPIPVGLDNLGRFSTTNGEVEVSK